MLYRFSRKRKSSRRNLYPEIVVPPSCNQQDNQGNTDFEQQTFPQTEYGTATENRLMTRDQEAYELSVEPEATVATAVTVVTDTDTYVDASPEPTEELPKYDFFDPLPLVSYSEDEDIMAIPPYETTVL